MNIAVSEAQVKNIETGCTFQNFINYTSRVTLWQKNSFVVEVTFNLEVEKNIYI